LLLLAVGIGLSAIGAALALDGPALVAAWSVEAVLLAWLARRLGRVRGYVAAGVLLALAALHALAFDAPTDQLATPGDLGAVVAVLLVVVAAAVVARLYDGTWEPYRDAVTALALAGLAYLPAVAFDGAWVVAA
jgi:small-conductance mechanosensitive channel